jgi:hypothetical protein
MRSFSSSVREDAGVPGADPVLDCGPQDGQRAESPVTTPKRFVPPRLTLLGDVNVVTAEREVFFS